MRMLHRSGHFLHVAGPKPKGGRTWQHDHHSLCEIHFYKLFSALNVHLTTSGKTGGSLNLDIGFERFLDFQGVSPVTYLNKSGHGAGKTYCNGS